MAQDGHCWMKYENGGLISKDGVTACITTKKPHPPPKPHSIETHGPYNHGNGWMAVNISPYPRLPPFPAKAPLKLFPPNTPITLAGGDGEAAAPVTGLTEPNVFASVRYPGLKLNIPP